MGKALEIVTGFVTAPSTTLTALTLAAGNTLTVRNTALDAQILLLAAWVDSQAGDRLRIRSPRLHDNVQGLRFSHVASEVTPLFPVGMMQRLVPQDVLTVELAGSATASDIETACLLIYYGDLPGIEARLITPEQLMERMVHMVTVENTLASGTAGGYSGEEAIDAEFDLLKANTDYALIGYQVSLECAAVRWRGSDFGNLGVGGPGNDILKEMTARWFLDLAMKTGLPLIPVFNSANRSAVLLDCAQDENGADPVVNTILAQLTPA